MWLSEDFKVEGVTYTRARQHEPCKWLLCSLHLFRYLHAVPQSGFWHSLNLQAEELYAW